jgi:pyruvate formate lyase activating enzyme
MLTVFNIQRFSLHDGNGIRTNIFFKGCPLRCQWCNNPESIDPYPSVMFDERLCNKFGECIKNGDGNILEDNGSLVINRGKIISPGSLRDVCPSKALWIAGREMSINEIVSEIEKDIPFYNMSGGGVTLSGGEPFAQGDDLIELLTVMKWKGIHISVETSLHVPWDKISGYLDLVDVFLADLKHTDRLKFQTFTGGNLDLVLGNFNELNLSGKEFVARVPVIPGFNHSEPEIFAIIDTAARFNNLSEIDFIPYHSLATEKYHMLGMEYTYPGFRNADRSELNKYAGYAEHKGLTTKILN